MEFPYAICVTLGILVGFLFKRIEERRLGYRQWHDSYRFVGAGALLGAVLGAKLGMLLFVPLDTVAGILADLPRLRFDGKTILGALGGGYAFGEITKRLLGVRFSTGDALAVALPLGHSIGRLGCLLSGCCYGTPTDLPWAVPSHGAWRHPTPLYESLLLLGLAVILYTIRRRSRPAGYLFRYYLVAYATIRFGLEALRGDPRRSVGPFSVAQLFCVGAAVTVVLACVVQDRARSRARTAA